MSRALRLSHHSNNAFIQYIDDVAVKTNKTKNTSSRATQDANTWQTIIKQPYRPTPYLWNGHAQTLFTAITSRLGLADHYGSPPYTREIINVHALSDGMHPGHCALDWCVCDPTSTTSTTPTLLILHGLAGGSNETYVRRLVMCMIKKGWRCVVMNARGCGTSNLSSPQLYCGAYTDDLRQAVYSIRQRLPHAPLIGVGYSLGANILVKYVGEERDTCTLNAAIAIANPWDLLDVNRHLDGSFFHRMLYSRGLTHGLKPLLSSVAHHFESDDRFDMKEAMSATTIRAFDAIMTAPCFNYATVEDFYRQGSSVSYLKYVSIPLLAISARDDPISYYQCIPEEECAANPNTIIMVTERGGHSMDWYTGWNASSWSVRVISTYLDNLLHFLPSLSHTATSISTPPPHTETSHSYPIPTPTPTHDTPSLSDIAMMAHAVTSHGERDITDLHNHHDENVKEHTWTRNYEVDVSAQEQTITTHHEDITPPPTVESNPVQVTPIISPPAPRSVTPTPLVRPVTPSSPPAMAISSAPTRAATPAPTQESAPARAATPVPARVSTLASIPASASSSSASTPSTTSEDDVVLLRAQYEAELAMSQRLNQLYSLVTTLEENEYEQPGAPQQHHTQHQHIQHVTQRLNQVLHKYTLLTNTLAELPVQQ